MRIRTLVSATALAAALSGCVSNSSGAPSPEATAQATGASVNCIDPQQISGRRIASSRALIFEMGGGVTYRNDLLEECPGLGRALGFKIIELDVHGAQLCSGDMFRAYDPAEAKAVGPQAFPRCRLGGFTPIARR
jgi:hypothetical protein